MFGASTQTSFSALPTPPPRYPRHESPALQPAGSAEPPEPSKQLPAAQPAAVTGALSVVPSILVVDDEEPVGAMLNMMLKRFGCGVRVARTGTEAAEQLRADNNIALVLLDVRMPGLDGLETLRLLQTIRPQLRCCFMTGDIGKYTEPELRCGGVLNILHKPFGLRDLAAVLRQAGIHTTP